MIKQVFKKILLSTTVFVGIALILSVLGAYISPQEFSYLVILNLAFPYILLLNIGALIFWIVIKHRYFIISAFAILLALPLISNTINFIPNKSDINKQESIKILSYNVRVFDLYNWSKNKVTRNKIFQFIRSENPEIACFQEFFNSTDTYYPVHDSLLRNQEFKYSHNYYNVEINNGNQFGIATYSIYPIVYKEEIIFKGTRNLAIISDIKIKQDTIRIINCHLESVRFLETDYHFIDSVTLLSEKRRIEGFKGVTKRLLNASQKRTFQANQIKTLAQSSPYPTFICGDLNDTPYSYTYSAIANKLNDSFKNHTLGIGGTYTRFFPPMRIDYIFYNKKIECNKFYTIKHNYSDHYPIIGNYSIK